MRSHPASITIVGGGSAGWMTASLMAHSWPKASITLVESSQVPTIGVGEGSTPYLKLFFQRLGIPDHDWMPECAATYKCGIRFTDWCTKPGYQSYFHPFFSRHDIEPASGYFDLCAARRKAQTSNVGPDHFFVSAALARAHKAPIGLDSKIGDIDYGYHFDAGLLGAYLKRYAISKGVNHVVDHVEQVHARQEGGIAAIQTSNHGRLKSEFYVDCTGFSALLIRRALNESFVSYQDTLLNDRAVAIGVPREGGTIASCTVSRALSSGWSWHIPLQNRIGNGYVYSSEFLQPEAAESELRKTLGTQASGLEAVHLKMRLGRVERHWRDNCLAVGLSQGFIEPLEATALMLIQITVDSFIEQYRSEGTLEQTQLSFNNSINRLFDGVKDYVSLHYLLNNRTDSSYWISAREEIMVSDSLQALEQAWIGTADFDQALQEQASQQIYLRPSWYCIFAGMGHFESTDPNIDQKIGSAAANARAHCDQVAYQFRTHDMALFSKR
jgi:hypothetical protein